MLLLEIYKHLIDADSISEVKTSLLNLILEDRSILHSSDKGSIREFETSLIAQEILEKALKKKDIAYATELFREEFGIEDYCDIIFASVQNLDKVRESDLTYDDQDIEELREDTYDALNGIFY